MHPHTTPKPPPCREMTVPYRPMPLHAPLWPLLPLTPDPCLPAAAWPAFPAAPLARTGSGCSAPCPRVPPVHGPAHRGPGGPGWLREAEACRVGLGAGGAAAAQHCVRVSGPRLGTLGAAAGSAALGVTEGGCTAPAQPLHGPYTARAPCTARAAVLNRPACQLGPWGADWSHGGSLREGLMRGHMALPALWQRQGLTSLPGLLGSRSVTSRVQQLIPGYLQWHRC